MDPNDAALAAKWLGAPYVIPVHYNTWPVIAQDPVCFKERVLELIKAEVLLPKPGETVEIP